MPSPARLPRLGESAGRPLEDRLVPTFGLTGLLSPVAAGAEPVAAVEAGPRLLAADTADSALLSGLLTALAGPGSSVALSAVDYEALSNGSVNLGTLLGRLQSTLGAGSPAAALTADATLGQLLTAAAGAARADGNTSLATIFDTSAGAVRSSAGTVRLGDLLDVSLPAGSFAQAEVNALDLLVGSVQLFNYQNAGTTAAAVALPAAALDPLGSAVVGVTVQARVVEPPVFVVGPAGSQFHSAAVRLKLDVDLADVSLDTTALAAPIRAAIGNAATVTAAATVGRLQVYADVARGSGSIQAIDALTNAVTLRSTPAVADVYLGTIADGVFADRTRGIDPATDLTPGLVGSFTASAAVLGTPLLNLNLGLTARSAAEGAAVLPYVTTYLPAFPKGGTVGSSAAVIGDLVATLVSNLRVGVNGDLGLLAPQANAVTAALSGAAATQLRPTLHALLGGTLDPALGQLGIGLGQVDLIVLGADSPDAPVAADDTVTTTAGQPVTVAVLANDTVQAGTTPVLTVSTVPQHGTVAVNADGSLTYTPAAGYLGADVVGYTLTDAFGRTSTATVRVQVNRGANSPPVVRPDAVATTAGVAVTFDPRANDTDADGDHLGVTLAAPPAHGTAVVNADGSITYTPAAGYVGADSFTYAAADGFGGSGTAVVSVQVGRGPNRTPVAVPDVASTTAGVAVTFDVRANDTDADGDALSVTATSSPAHGTVAINADGTLTYTPAAGFVGADAFVYLVADGFGGSATGTVTVQVGRGPNRSPVAGPDAPTTTIDKPVTVNVLANDSDPDGDPLTVTGVSAPASGTAVVNADGTVTYSPFHGFHGSDSFTYTVTDGHGGTATGMVSVTVGQSAPVPPTVPPSAPPTVPPAAPPTVPPAAPPTVPPTSPPAVPPTVPPTSPPAVPPASPPTVPPPAPPTVPPAAPPTTPPVSPPASPPAGSPPGGDSHRRPFAVGADTTGGPRVTVYNADGTQRFNFFAYDPAGRFGVDVTLADVTGDGVADIVTVPGVGGGPHVRVFDGVTLAEVFNFFAFEPSFRGGLSVATGDYDGDGRPDIIVGAGDGGGPRVRVFSGRDGSTLADFFAADAANRNGAVVAAADFNADGRADIVAATGRGVEARVRVIDAATGRPLRDVAPFEAGYTGATNVAAGDITGDGVPDLVMGAGYGGGPRVRVFDGVSGQVVEDRFVYEQTFTGGVRVAALDLDGDGRAEVLAGAGVGGGPRLEQVTDGSVTQDRFVFEDSFRGGIQVG